MRWTPLSLCQSPKQDAATHPVLRLQLRYEGIAAVEEATNLLIGEDTQLVERRLRPPTLRLTEADRRHLPSLLGGEVRDPVRVPPTVHPPFVLIEDPQVNRAGPELAEIREWAIVFWEPA